MAFRDLSELALKLNFSAWRSCVKKALVVFMVITSS